MEELGEKTTWLPGCVNKPYRDHYDEIKWESNDGVARKGKARESTNCMWLQANEAVKAARTPIGERTDKTFRHLD